jgi:hypothetical protein
MNIPRTLGIALTLTIFLGGPVLAKPKDDDDKKKHGNSANAGKKNSSRGNASAVSLQNTQLARRSVAVAPSRRAPATVEVRSQEQSYRTSTSDRDRDRDGDRDRDRDYSNDGRRRDSDRGWSRYQYYRAPSNAYRGWNTGRTYSWNNHRYHWYDGSWIIINPGYDYVESRSTRTYVGGNDVYRVQAQLNRRGYDAGPADGVMGGNTRRAIARFQRDRGLRVTGEIDRSLLLALD